MNCTFLGRAAVMAAAATVLCAGAVAVPVRPCGGWGGLKSDEGGFCGHGLK